MAKINSQSYINAMAQGINFLASKPANPQIGDAYVDQNTYYSFVWTGNSWTQFSGDNKDRYIEPKFMPPTEEQLEKHPALKQAWEEFIVIKKLVGV